LLTILESVEAERFLEDSADGALAAARLPVPSSARRRTVEMSWRVVDKIILGEQRRESMGADKNAQDQKLARFS
jgi:hypothetical protein